MPAQKAIFSLTGSLLALTAASVVHAQDVSDPVTADDIVVTAQRVQQNLQDVPLAVTAVGAQALQNANVTDATRLELLAPGLTIGRSGTDLRPAIRGVRTENVGANADPTIGFFIDGIYQSRPSQALSGFVDLERVEVLRGPQGTLFGRNTYGGAISLVSAAPKEGFSAGANVLYGRFNRLRTDAFLNTGGDHLQFRLAGAYERADGFVKNSSTGGDLGKDEQVYLRPSVSVSSGDMKLVLRTAYWKQDGSALGAFGYKSRGTMIDPNTLSATNRGGSLGTGALPFSYNTRIRDGIADITVGGIGYDVGVPVGSDPYAVNFDTPAVLDNKMWQASADFSYDLGAASLRLITGYTDWYSYRSIDNDFSPFPIAQDINITDSRTFSQELQFVGDSGGPLEWIVGGYYYKDRIVETFFNDQNNTYPALGTPQASGPPFTAGTPTGSPFALTRADSITPVTVRTESWAGFGQATYRVSPQFAFTGGLRYTSDQKRYTRQFRSAAGLNLADGPTAPATVGQALQEATFNKLTWKAGVEFKPREESLLYGQVSTGFTSGGFNGGNVAVAGQTVGLPPFNPQTILAYEIGSKNRFIGDKLQLNIALFYNDLNNLQVQSQVPLPGGTTVISTTGNAGAARSYGGEIEAVIRPASNVSLGLNATYLNAKYNTLRLSNPFPNPTIVCNTTAQGAPIPLAVGTLRCVQPVAGVFVAQVDLAGARIPYSPELTLQAYLNWDIETSVGKITPSVNMLYNSGYQLTDFNTGIDKQEGFSKTDVRLTWTSKDGQLTVQAYVENLENTAVNQRGVFGSNQSLNASYAMPRTYGIKAGLRF